MSALLRAQALVRRTLRLDVRRWTPAASAGARRARLLADGEITLVLDVGANQGQFGEELRAGGYRGRIVSFEPLAGAFAELERRSARDPAWESRRLALGETDGEVEINVSENTWSSSVLPIDERHVRAAPESRFVASERVRQARLDGLDPPAVRPGERVYLKADVQGYERQVLEGARGVMDAVAAIECELSLVPLYEGQPLFEEMLEWMRAAGYGLVSIEPGFADPATGHVLQVDGIFLRGRDQSQ